MWQKFTTCNKLFSFLFFEPMGEVLELLPREGKKPCRVELGICKKKKKVGKLRTEAPQKFPGKTRQQLTTSSPPSPPIHPNSTSDPAVDATKFSKFDIETLIPVNPPSRPISSSVRRQAIRR
jgi:hypothetical protein